jgi:hypothetical protein
MLIAALSCTVARGRESGTGLHDEQTSKIVPVWEKRAVVWQKAANMPVARFPWPGVMH